MKKNSQGYEKQAKKKGSAAVTKSNRVLHGERAKLAVSRSKNTEVSHKNTDKSNETIENFDSYLGYSLRMVSNQVTHAFQQRLSEKNSTVAEWITLRYLHSRSHCSLTKLAEEMGMDKGALSRLLEKLENKALIARSFSGSDRRVSALKLTAAGRRLVPVLAKIARQHHQFFFGHLKPKELKAILHFLKDLAIRHSFRGKPVN